MDYSCQSIGSDCSMSSTSKSNSFFQDAQLDCLTAFSKELMGDGNELEGLGLCLAWPKPNSEYCMLPSIGAQPFKVFLAHNSHGSCTLQSVDKKQAELKISTEKAKAVEKQFICGLTDLATEIYLYFSDYLGGLPQHVKDEAQSYLAHSIARFEMLRESARGDKNVTARDYRTLYRCFIELSAFHSKFISIESIVETDIKLAIANLGYPWAIPLTSGSTEEVSTCLKSEVSQYAHIN